MTTVTTPDFAAIAEHLAALGVPTEPLHCGDPDHDDEQIGLVLPDRHAGGRRVWTDVRWFPDGWDLCSGLGVGGDAQVGGGEVEDVGQADRGFRQPGRGAGERGRG